MTPYECAVMELSNLRLEDRPALPEVLKVLTDRGWVAESVRTEQPTRRYSITPAGREHLARKRA
jgi:DNA-binding PadR family transcriptional regulator